MDYHAVTPLVHYIFGVLHKKEKCQVMYWYGAKEMECVKKSAKLFQSYVPSCEIYEAKGYNHGYLAIYLPEEWLTIAIPFFQK